MVMEGRAEMLDNAVILNDEVMLGDEVMFSDVLITLGDVDIILHFKVISLL